MRYTPAALALSLLVAVTSSASYSAAPETLDPRAVVLVEDGRKQLDGGNVDAAIDAYEAALAVSPGSTAVYLGLAEATRKQGMQGKALHYYREALEGDPQNLKALAGEGAALVEKGAVDKAKRNLTRLQGLCGETCTEARELAAAIARGPSPKVVTAAAITPEPVVSEN